MSTYGRSESGLGLRRGLSRRCFRRGRFHCSFTNRRRHRRPRSSRRHHPARAAGGRLDAGRKRAGGRRADRRQRRPYHTGAYCRRRTRRQRSARRNSPLRFPPDHAGRRKAVMCAGPGRTPGRFPAGGTQRSAGILSSGDGGIFELACTSAPRASARGSAMRHGGRRPMAVQ